MSRPTATLAALFDGPSRWHTLHHREEVGSTNDVAAQALREGSRPGLVVVADHQRAGRGRAGHGWEDRPGGASLLVSVTVPVPGARTLVPLAAGLAVLDALATFGVTATLKWPNDVLVGDGKLAGVLTEGHEGGLVVGIGTNIDLRGAPVEGATSVAEHLAEVQAAPDRWDVLVAELHALDRWLGVLEQGHEDAVVTAYRERCSTLGRDVTVDLADGTTLAGRALDISVAGALVVGTDDGPREVTAGDVHHVRRA